jgi:hypothetical protein
MTADSRHRSLTLALLLAAGACNAERATAPAPQYVRRDADRRLRQLRRAALYRDLVWPHRAPDPREELRLRSRDVSFEVGGSQLGLGLGDERLTGRVEREELVI